MWLKQSTAFTFRIGPFVDDADGKTAETSLTLSQADFRLSKAGGAFAQKNDTTAGSHDENGWYTCVLNTTDTGTLGTLDIAVHESGALPVFARFMVVPANVYDSLIGGSDRLQVHTDEITNNLITASAIADGAIDAATFAASAITASAIATDAFTAAKFASDVTTEFQSGLATASALSTVAGYLDTEVAAILADTNELQTDLADGGRLDLLIDAIKAKTDSLTFTVAGQVDANLQYVNDVQVTGTGAGGDEWGPA